MVYDENSKKKKIDELFRDDRKLASVPNLA